MTHTTSLVIALEISDGAEISEVLEGLPDYCVSTFSGKDGFWAGEFPVTCPVAPELAEGDFEDDLCPHFPTLLRLKKFHAASYELRIAVGPPGENFFRLEDDSVSLLAALGASINIEAAGKC